MVRLKVKEIAQAQGISMAKLSRMSDLNPQTLRSIYSNPFRDVAFSTLLKLAKALNVDVADLTEEIPDK